MARNSQYGLPGSKFIIASFNSACRCLLSSLFFFSLSTSLTTLDRLPRPFSTWVCCCCCCSCCCCCCCCCACFCCLFCAGVARLYCAIVVVVGVGGMFSSSRRPVSPETESPWPFTDVVDDIMFVGRPVGRVICLFELAKTSVQKINIASALLSLSLILSKD